jgi:Holliday junction DNA helicase RuvA
MIGYLEGKAVVRGEQLIVMVAGVGYLVNVGQKLLTKANSEEISLHIYTHVKEDRLELYGFQTAEELEIFKLVISVSGVGPKTAINIINGGVNQLIEAVQQAQLSFFTAVPRVGKKLAQKIIIELKGKLGSLKELNLATLSPKEQDVMDALLGLGFDENMIQDALSQIDLENMEINVAIKESIKIASGKK